VSGCGIKEATKQANPNLKINHSADEQPFHLTEVNDSVSYAGNLLIWNTAATPEKIAAISESSVKGRLAKDADLAFVRDELMPAKDRLAQKQKELGRASAAVKAA